MKKSSPKDLILAITYRCNSRCRMCDIWKKTDHSYELTLNDLAKLPRELRDVNLTGGEPFLRQDLFEIVKVISGRCPKVKIIISTNGFATALILEQMEKILSVRPDIGVAVSLDGIGDKHNEIRGVVGGFDKAMATINGLKNIGVKNLKIGFTIGDYNPDELSKVYGLARGLGAEFSLAVVHSSDNYFGRQNIINDRDSILKQLEWLKREELSSWNYKKIARAYFTHGAMEFLKTGRRILPDYSGALNIFIDPLGNIFPCDVSSKKIGDIKNMPDYFAKEAEGDCARSWMMCTARPAIKKHWFKAGTWMLVNKLKSLR